LLLRQEGPGNKIIYKKLFVNNFMKKEPAEKQKACFIVMVQFTTHGAYYTRKGIMTSSSQEL